MTDKKEIIINGINLKECKYFKGVGCINSSFKFWGCTKLGGMCSEHPDCYFKQLKRKEQELLNQEKIINKLIRERDNFEQECENYKEKVEYIHAFLRNPHNYGSFKPMWGSFLLHWLFNENLGDFFPEKAYEMADTIEEKEKQIIKYKQALDEIENYVRDNSDFDKSDKLTSNTGAYDILEIINKTKEQ